MLHLDLYRKPLQLFVEKEEPNYRTLSGSVLSILTVLVIVLYAGYKLDTMFSLDEYKV